MPTCTVLPDEFGAYIRTHTYQVPVDARRIGTLISGLCDSPEDEELQLEPLSGSTRRASVTEPGGLCPGGQVRDERVIRL
jgi:hypothetical protein